MTFVGEHSIAGKGGFVVRTVDKKGVAGIERCEIVELAVEFFWDAVNRRIKSKRYMASMISWPTLCVIPCPFPPAMTQPFANMYIMAGINTHQ